MPRDGLSEASPPDKADTGGPDLAERQYRSIYVLIASQMTLLAMILIAVGIVATRLLLSELHLIDLTEPSATRVDLGDPSQRPPDMLGYAVASRLDLTTEKWERVLALYGSGAGISVARLPQDAVAFWDRALAIARRGGHSEEGLNALNRYINQVPYRSDWDNYGLVDYWAVPLEFIADGGDCEDYAAAKYIALVEAGWSKNDVYVATGRLPNGEDHTVVVARAKKGVGETWMVLDNRYQDVYPIDSSADFLPSFSMSDNQTWLYRADCFDPVRRPSAGEIGRDVC